MLTKYLSFSDMSVLDDLIASDILKAWDEGILHFNNQLYWEAHESWEFKWKSLPQVHQKNLQALIQAAAVLVHLQKGNLDPARRLARSALLKWNEALDMGLAHLQTKVEIPAFELWLQNFLDHPTVNSFSEAKHLIARLKSSKS